jgi:hypothetical protein
MARTDRAGSQKLAQSGAPIKIREDLPDASASKTSLTDVHGTIVKDIIA